MTAAIRRPTKRPAAVRISATSHLRLRELAAQESERMCVVLEKVLEQYRRKRFREEMDAAYAALQQDPEAWADCKTELAL